MVLDQAKASVVSFLAHLEFHNQVFEVVFGLKKSTKYNMAFSKVNKVGTTEFIRGNSTVVSHGAWSLR